MENTKVKRILDQCTALEDQRRPHEGVWDDLGQICFPRHGVLSQHRTPPGGQSLNERQRISENFDGTAMRACNTLATGQAARITPLGARWFMLRPPARMKNNQAALNWWAACSEILSGMLASSNFYNRAFQCYQFRGGHGISAMEVTAGPQGRGLHFRTFPTGSYSIAENSQDEVDTIFRSYFMSPAQIVDMFGKDGNIPAAVTKLAADAAKRHKPSEKVVHAIYPRQDRDPRASDAMNKPVASCHVHAGSETMLLESGFDSVPVAVSRWETTPLSPYGWGPADYALPEAAQANFQEQMLDVLAETAAFPRILFPAGMKDEISFEAMGLTSFDPNAGENAWPREWLTGGRYDIGKDRAADKRRAIESAFFVDLFQAVSRLPSDATATQVSAIVSESRELFHPIFSNMVREFHTPIIRRAWQIAALQGVFPTPPAAVIEGGDLGAFIADPEVEYVSSMALALELSHLGGLNDIIQVLTPLASMDPAWIDFLNPATVGPHLVRAKGLPTIFLRSEKELEALAQSRAQALQAQQAEAAAGAVRNMGGVDEVAKAAQMVGA